MNIRTILDFVNFKANKVQEGNTMSKDQYNTLLEVFNNKMFEEEYALVEMQAKEAGLATYDTIYSNSSIRAFRKLLLFTTVGGEANVPDDYKKFISFIAKYGDQERKISVVSDDMMNIKRTSILESPASIEPVVCIYDSVMKFMPKDIGASSQIEMVYLRKPLTPYYDSCVALASGLEVFMPVGSNIRTYGTVLNLYESATSSNIIQANVSHSSGLSPYTSKTVELEWDEKMQLTLIDLLLQAFGVNTRTELK